jgi:hypothetical protein
LSTPVWVNLEMLLPCKSTREPPAKDDDLRVVGEVAGVLQEWVRGSRGLWLGLVRFDLSTVSGESVALESQLVPEYAMRLRDGTEGL